MKTYCYLFCHKPVISLLAFAQPRRWPKKKPVSEFPGMVVCALMKGTNLGPLWIDLVGTAAATLTTAAFFPQAIKTLRTGNTNGLSLVMYVLMVTGVALWFVYGLIIHDWPLIISNIIVLVPQTAILAHIVCARKSLCR